MLDASPHAAADLTQSINTHRALSSLFCVFKGSSNLCTVHGAVVLPHHDEHVRSARLLHIRHDSIRLPGGRLEPQLDRVSLVSRQQTFGNAMKAKRDRLKPRSRNLVICKGLVAGLENGFDGMAPQASKNVHEYQYKLHAIELGVWSWGLLMYNVGEEKEFEERDNCRCDLVCLWCPYVLWNASEKVGLYTQATFL